LFDRRVVIVDQATNLDLGLAQSFWLTAEKNSSLQLAAGTTGRDELDWLPFMRQMLHWYSQVITHRRAGDKLEFGEQYYLYH
jgi:ABC-type amino acid transport system permease subunit